MIPRGKGIGIANWLVSKTGGMLDSKLSRRSFISRATLVGTAAAVVGCRRVALESGSPFGAVVRVSDCPPFTLCRDGYTEFCCVINGGVNSCPPNTIPAGWWRADYSVFCDGTRYYIDCNEICCGPRRKDGFCASCSPCVCGNGCNTRKVYCNYFRYGQCNQFAAHIGPIACRMVTCVPPYLLNIGCTPSGAVDNSTAGHYADCDVAAPAPPAGGGGGAPAPPPPPPPPMASVLPALGGGAATIAGFTHVFARHADGKLWERVEQAGGLWGAWTDLGAAVSSGGSAVVDSADDLRVYFRRDGNTLGELRNDGGGWFPVTDLQGTFVASDPVAIVFGGLVYVFARLTGAGLWYRTFNPATSNWSAWMTLMTTASSTPAVAATPSTIFLFSRLSDVALWVTSSTGVNWTAVESLGGALASDPSVIALGNEVFAFARWTDNTLKYRHRTGSTWAAWAPLDGDLTSDPVAAVFGGNVYVFARHTGDTLQYRRWNGTTWTNWASLGGPIGSDALQVLDDGPLLRVFAAFTDNHLWQISYDGAAWSAWEDLGAADTVTNLLALTRGS